MSSYEGGSFPGGTSTLDRASDGEPLVAFVWTLYDDLDVLLGQGSDSILFRAAVDGEAGPNLLAALGLLAGAWPNVLRTRDDVIAAIRDPDNVARLVSAGLTGPELAFKLALWSWARDEWSNVLRLAGGPIDGRHSSGTPPAGLRVATALPKVTGLKGFVRGFFTWGQRTLEFADTALGSLAKVVQMSERLEEVKQSVEKILGVLHDDLPENR
jgi:hypothetical protein